MTLPEVGGSREYTSDMSSTAVVFSLSLSLASSWSSDSSLSARKRAKQSVAFSSLFRSRIGKQLEGGSLRLTKESRREGLLREYFERRRKRRKQRFVFRAALSTFRRVVVWLFLLFSQRRGEASHGEAASTNTNTFTGRERRRPWRCIRGEDDARGERIRRE